MTRDEIIRKAKYIVFPYRNNTYSNYYKDIDAKYAPIIPDGSVLYSNMKGNEHHYTTEYTYKYVLPLIAELLGFKFDMNDFDLIDCKQPEWDISYIVPKQKYEYEIFNYVNDEHNSCDYMGLFKPTFETTHTYRELYRYPHQCSSILNKTLQSERRLMISGDSQIIPSINPLTNYFKEVWYFDNRTGYYKDEGNDKPTIHENEFTSYSDFYKDVNFTDVLMQCYCRKLEWYQYYNLQ